MMAQACSYNDTLMTRVCRLSKKIKNLTPQNAIQTVWGWGGGRREELGCQLGDHLHSAQYKNVTFICMNISKFIPKANFNTSRVQHIHGNLPSGTSCKVAFFATKYISRAYSKSLATSLAHVVKNADLSMQLTTQASPPFRFCRSRTTAFPQQLPTKQTSRNMRQPRSGCTVMTYFCIA